MFIRVALIVSLLSTGACAHANFNEQLVHEKAAEIINHFFAPLTLEQQQPIAQWAKQSYQLSILECTMRTIMRNMFQAALTVKTYKNCTDEDVDSAVKKLTHNLSLFAKCKPMYDAALKQWNDHAAQLDSITDQEIATALNALVEFTKLAIRAYGNSLESVIAEQLEQLQTSTRATISAQQLIDNTVVALLDHNYPFELAEEDYILGQLDMGLALARNSNETHIKALQEIVALENLELQLVTFSAAIFDGYCKAIFTQEVEEAHEDVVHN